GGRQPRAAELEQVDGRERSSRLWVEQVKRTVAPQERGFVSGNVAAESYLGGRQGARGGLGRNCHGRGSLRYPRRRVLAGGRIGERGGQRRIAVGEGRHYVRVSHRVGA